jgi:hypothetical protein
MSCKRMSYADFPNFFKKVFKHNGLIQFSHPVRTFSLTTFSDLKKSDKNTFDSESYPGWTTISTGLYPESHGILGNRMFDLKNNVMFDLNNETSTKMLHWWQDAEPIWTTATRNNKKSYLRLWSRCDVPFDEIIPDKCTGYREARGVQVIRHTLDLAIDHLLKDYQLAMVKNILHVSPNCVLIFSVILFRCMANIWITLVTSMDLIPKS